MFFFLCIQVPPHKFFYEGKNLKVCLALGPAVVPLPFYESAMMNAQGAAVSSLHPVHKHINTQLNILYCNLACHSDSTFTKVTCINVSQGESQKQGSPWPPHF